MQSTSPSIFSFSFCKLVRQAECQSARWDHFLSKEEGHQMQSLSTGHRTVTPSLQLYIVMMINCFPLTGLHMAPALHYPSSSKSSDTQAIAVVYFVVSFLVAWHNIQSLKFVLIQDMCWHRVRRSNCPFCRLHPCHGSLC